MTNKARYFSGVTAALALVTCITSAFADGNLNWRAWTGDLFDIAKQEKKLVILDLEAVWCHWCHVMEEETYGDANVKAILAKHFVTVRVDQDANPDISNRYGDWGWPATIIFASDGTELAKLRGYIPPLRMASLLNAFVKDPTPGPSALSVPDVKPAPSIYLSKAQRTLLQGNYAAVYDKTNGGWGNVQKFIHSDSMDHALKMAAGGDAGAAAMAQETLDAALNLIDREWGGVYQYSDQADWKSPHYEKIMSFQTQYLRQYSFAYSLWKKPAYRTAADDIYRYLTELLLSPEGGFYTSQDADLNRTVDGKEFYALKDAARRKLKAMPRIDKNIYARENGWAISGLVAYYNATGRDDALKKALDAARWTLKHRGLKGGGFKHGARDRGGPYLGDNLAMAQAALDLYFATGGRKWLQLAAGTADFIMSAFKDEAAGFLTAKTSAASALGKPVRQIEENIQLARFANILQRTHGAEKYRKMAAHVMRYLASPDLTKQRRFLIGVVLADDELSVEPAHITIVGHKDDPRAQALHAAARAYPAMYKRVDWWDKREGPLTNPDVQYPEMDRAAAFACANRICSPPVFEPGDLAAKVKRMLKIRTTRIAGE